MADQRYSVPAKTHRVETKVVNSRFIATILRVETVSEAKEALANIRVEMSDASHHCYAFRVGYGNSVVEGMSDDGEPSGTAGPPILAVLRGSNIGDTLIVVTRYFGGTKLGTGGLVRAYGAAARTGLSELEIEEKIPYRVIGIEMPYSVHDIIKHLINQHNGIIEDETFAGEVTIIARFTIDDLAPFTDELTETTANRVQPILFDDGNG